MNGVALWSTPMPTKPDDLRLCRLCGGPAQVFTRWRAIGSGPPERLYIWVECDSIPPCEVGDCCQTEEEAVSAWNRRAPDKIRGKSSQKVDKRGGSSGGETAKGKERT